MSIPATDLAAARAYLAFSPQSLAATGTVNGGGIDRAPAGGGPRALCGKLTVLIGAVTGTPTAISVACVVEQSTDNSTFVALNDRDGVAVAIAPLTAINTAASVDFQLDAGYRYIRAVPTAALTAGSSPTVLTSGVISLSGFDELPHGG